MNKKNIIFGLLFVMFMVSGLVTVTAEENNTIAASVNHGSYSTYTIHYSNGSS